MSFTVQLLCQLYIFLNCSVEYWDLHVKRQTNFKAFRSLLVDVLMFMYKACLDASKTIYLS